LCLYWFLKKYSQGGDNKNLSGSASRKEGKMMREHDQKILVLALGLTGVQWQKICGFLGCQYPPTIHEKINLLKILLNR